MQLFKFAIMQIMLIIKLDYYINFYRSNKNDTQMLRSKKLQ